MFGLPGLCRPVVVQTPLGPWSPRRPLSLTALRNAGCPGLELWERVGPDGEPRCEEEVDVMRELEGRVSVCACICLHTCICTPSGFPPTPHFHPYREQSLPLWAPAGQAGSASLRPGSLRPPGKANCQRRCFTGGGCCVRCQVTLTLLKNTNHTLQDPSHQNHSELWSGSVWAKDSLDSFLWLLIRTTGMKNFPYLEVTDKLFAFGKH